METSHCVPQGAAPSTIGSEHLHPPFYPPGCPFTQALALPPSLIRSPCAPDCQIWELYIPWAKGFGVKDTAIRVYRRFLKYDPSFREHYVDYLEAHGEIDEAAQQLAICVNDDMFISPKGQWLGTRPQAKVLPRRACH